MIELNFSATTRSWSRAPDELLRGGNCHPLMVTAASGPDCPIGDKFCTLQNINYRKLVLIKLVSKKILLNELINPILGTE